MELSKLVMARQLAPRMPRRVLIYVAAAVLLAMGSAWLSSATTPGWREPTLPVTVIFVLLIMASERLVIRVNFENGEALVLLEGLAAPLIFCASGERAIIVVALGVALGQVITGNDPIKRLFNVAQWVTALSTGVLVWHALGLGHDGSLATLAGFALSLATVTTVNQILISGVLWCATGHPLGLTDTRDASSLIRGRAFNLVVNAILGILGTAAYLWQPWTVVVMAGLVASLHVAGRAGVSIRVNQQRMLALQRATHHLSTSLDTSALEPFLREMRAGFQVGEIQLTLLGGEGIVGSRTYGCGDDEALSVSVAGQPLVEQLATFLTEPARFVAGRGQVGAALTALGRADLLAAPLRSGSHTVGVLLMFDRNGPEGFETGELAVAAAVARELVGFLDRVELVREIDEERRKLADVVDHTSDGIISLDADGTILSWNAAFAAMTGYSAEEMVGTRHLALLRPRDGHGNDLHLSGWADRIEDIGLSPEMQFITADGSAVWVSCSYSLGPVNDSGRAVLIVVARNITQARELELLKDDFIAVVSHELRTPLVPIKGWAQTLLNRGDRLSDDQRRTAVQSILSQAQRLETLVLNILESSRVEAGHAESMDVVDVAAVALRVVEEVQAARPERAIRCGPPSVPCHVRGSAVWVERAIMNLLGNAVKYSPDDQPVDVVVELRDGNVSLSVTDRGPGIPVDARERVFARFERLEESGKQTGTGLGLYITRRLARGMGGDVTVSSVPGAGSTFVLTLPSVVDGASAAMPMPAQRATRGALNRP